MKVFKGVSIIIRYSLSVDRGCVRSTSRSAWRGGNAGTFQPPLGPNALRLVLRTQSRSAICYSLFAIHYLRPRVLRQGFIGAQRFLVLREGFVGEPRFASGYFVSHPIDQKRDFLTTRPG